MSQTAVIIGVGEAVDRPGDVRDALEPIALMAAALRDAERDSGGVILSRIDRLDLVGLVSWRYRDPVRQLAETLAIAPAEVRNASMGGETPIRLLHEAALAIERGEIAAAAIVGGEATHSRNRARKEGVALPWTPAATREEAVRFPSSSFETSRPAHLLGMLDPANIYPFYEVATQAAWGQQPREAQERSARVWERYAAVAAENPSAWIRSRPTADAIAEISADNRTISWPYPKLMVANPGVNQAAAMIVTSLELARELGVPEDRMIYIWGGAAANEPEDYLARDSYSHSTAQAAVLSKVSAIAGGSEAFDHMELYSCFPVVPKMALRTLGIDEAGAEPSVAGGLTFFGGPLNNYMGHATAAMVRKLRDNPEDLGLLYGQGGYVTKHHAVLLSMRPPAGRLDPDYSVQAGADGARLPIPELIETYDGEAVIETYTVTHARDGLPLQGVVIARTPAGQRLMARVRESDEETLTRLTSFDRNAVGATGRVRLDAFGKLTFTLASKPAARRFAKVVREGSVTIVTIDRPESMNSLNPAANEELADIFDEFAADPDQWIAIITSEGDKAFSAGNDLKETARLMKRGSMVETPLTGFGGLTARFDLAKPVIAAVNGLAMGGGFEIALACDIIIASETARFALPEPKVGLAALAGGLLRLPQQIGLKQAMGMVLTGRSVDAHEAQRLGFVNEVVASTDLLDAARRWAALMLEASPMSLRASKQIVLNGMAEASLADAYVKQNRYPATRALFRSADLKEGPAAFAQKRKPEWKGK